MWQLFDPVTKVPLAMEKRQEYAAVKINTLYSDCWTESDSLVLWLPERLCILCICMSSQKSFQPLTCIAQLWKEPSTLQMSDLSCPRTQLCLGYATWFSGNMTPASRLKTRFIHIANEEAAMNTAALHRLWDVSNIRYRCDVFISTSVSLVQWWENSQVFIQNQCLTVAFTVFSHEHVTKQCSVWMRISQLAFMLLGPELEAVLLNQWDIEANLLH